MVVRRLPNTDSELYHYGIKGQHWGVRRYQNADGSLTDAGKGRYSSGKSKTSHHSKINLSPKAKKGIKIALAAVAGLTLAGAATYLGYKYIKPQTLIKNVRSMKIKNNALTKKLNSRNESAKKVSLMTDEQLDAGIKRLKLEKQYTDLVDESLHKSKIQLDDTVQKVGNATLYTLLAGTTAYTIRSAITGEQDREILADYVAPKPNKNKKK